MKIDKQLETKLYELMFLVRDFRRKHPNQDFVITEIEKEGGGIFSEEEFEALDKEVRLMETLWDELSKTEKLAVTRRVKQMKKRRAR